MKSSLRASWLAAVPLAACLLPAPALAQQAPSKGKGRGADERLFVLYVLEHLHREPLPSQKGAGLKAHLARKKAVVQQLIRRLQLQRLDEEILEQAQAYAEVLDGTLQGTAKLAELYRKHILPAQQALEEEMQAQQARQQMNFSNAVLTGLTRGLTGYFLGDRSGGEATLDGLLAGFGRLMTDQRRDLPKQRQRWAQLQKQLTDAQKMYADETAELTADLVRRHQVAVKGLRDKARAAALVLADKHQWAAAEVPFGTAAVRTEDRPRDPLTLLALIRARPLPEEGAAEACLRRALEVILLNKLIPFADVYKPFRAEVYAAAGELANRACALEAGPEGFKPAKAAPTAVQAWTQYYKNLPSSRELKPFHQMLLAYAYSGAKQQAAAYRLLKQRVLPPSEAFYTQHRPRMGTEAAAQQRLSQFESWWHGENCRALPDARFWFDCARLCSGMRDVKNGFHCLRNALACGYQDREVAAAHPELEPLRQANRRQFDQLLKGGPEGEKEAPPN